jgi:transcriptional regulator with XRE-family HTH domain
MREARQWSQEELAAKVGMPQTAISRLESTRYGKPTITTLKRMAKVYDVALEVRFVPFSKFVDWISGTPYTEYGLSSDAIDVASYEEEERGGAFLANAPSANRHLPRAEASGVTGRNGPRLDRGQITLALWVNKAVEEEDAPQNMPPKMPPMSTNKNISVIPGELANAAAVGATR